MNAESREVYQKWGFGMAPPKPSTQVSRIASAVCVVAYLDTEAADEALPTALAEIKGLFSRVARQDQWDWFTTSRTLGYPSARVAMIIASTLGSLRRGLAGGPGEAARDAWLLLRRLPCRPCLRILMGTAQIAEEEGAGWTYLLSTRELPDLLKVGMTTRSVEERVREINAATGVVFPFGVRRCWRVSDPARAEKLVHRALDQHRVRSDREFFRASFREAAAIIDATLFENRLELRTLDNLAAQASIEI